MGNKLGLFDFKLRYQFLASILAASEASKISGSNIINPNWEIGSDLDPNGDNWGDCGWDGYCPGDPNDTNGDENGTESNQQWDIGEGFEKNGKYD